MDKIEGNYLAQDGNDFPLDCETFDNIQKNTHMAEILGNIGGPKLFLTGCEKDGFDYYSAGYVFVKTTAYPDGEVLRWPGGRVSNNTVYVSTTDTPVTINGTTYSAAYTTRVLSAVDPGGGADSFNFSEFVYVEDNRPLIGEIKMFAGPTDKIPKNYELCTGQELKKDEYPLLYALIGDMYNEGPCSDVYPYCPTYEPPREGYFRIPDLRGRFIVGYSFHRVFGNQSYSMVGAGGEAYVTLTSEQSAMPYHSHEATGTIKEAGWHHHGTFGERDSDKSPYGVYSAYANNWGSNGGGDKDNYTYKTSTDGYHTHDITISTVAKEREIAFEGHENRPPYYVMAYIIRVR